MLMICRIDAALTSAPAAPREAPPSGTAALSPDRKEDHNECTRRIVGTPTAAPPRAAPEREIMTSEPTTLGRTALGSMPAFAPLFLPGTEQVTVRWISIVYPTTAAVVDAILPTPLQRGAEPEIMIWIGEFIGAQFQSPDGTVETRPSYMQGGINVHCNHAGSEGAYAIETFVEGLNHGILGRELFGLPKKQVQTVTFDEAAHDVDFSFSDARGRTLLRGTAARHDEHRDRPLVPAWFENQYTAKLIPSAEGDGYDVSRLVRIPFGFTPTGETGSGAATLEWVESSSDPLHLLTVAGDATAVWGTARLDIDYGTYIAELNPHDIPAYGTPRW